jgi:hypothetical protein
MVSVRSRANCQHHGGPGLDLDERFNIRELLLAPSEEREPKVLTGSSQKAMRRGVPSRTLGTHGQ